VALETTVFSFKISVPFELKAAVYDSEEKIMQYETLSFSYCICCIYEWLYKEQFSNLFHQTKCNL